MDGFNAKRISDPVHGTIGLSDLELQIIDTPVFQRLRNVKQLGLAYFVFPSGDYSRFAHSLGVCHITGRILETLRSESKVALDEEEIQKYRLAGLLHDVGHYPFSHTMEDAVKNYCDAFLLQPKMPVENDTTSATETVGDRPEFINHESLGKEILSSDSQVQSIFKKAGIKAEEIYAIFLREKPPRFANLISSDMDADRIDYLLRTTHHTGLPYGSVDINYLLSQMRVDDKNNVCLTAKALRTADHFLLCRYFDFQQVAYHKAVKASELVLEEVIEMLLRDGYIDCSKKALVDRITSNAWKDFDDAYLLHQMQTFLMNSSSEIETLKVRSILLRKPPKLVAEVERIGRREQSDRKRFLQDKQLIKDKINGWADGFKIDRSLWYSWDKESTLTKIDPYLPASALSAIGEDYEDKQQQTLRVLDMAGNSSNMIGDIPRSLMSVLARYALYSLRVYVLLPDDKLDMRVEIQRRIREDLPNMDLT